MLARSALLAFSLLILVGLLGLWWTLTKDQGSPALPDRESVLAANYSEEAFRNEATSDDLLEFARSELFTIREAHPSSAMAWNALGDFHLRTSNSAEAEKAWKQSLEFDRSNVEALFGLANIAFEAGDYDKSAALCESIQAMDSHNPRVPLLLADTYLNQNKPQLAALTLEQHIASEQTSVKALEMLGSAHVRLQNYDEAIDVLQAALGFDPNSTKALYEIAQAYRRKKDSENATKYLEQFQELSKEQAESTSNEAQQFVDRDHAVSVTSQVLADLAVAYRVLGDNTACEDKLLRALKLQPDRLAWLQLLLTVYQDQKKSWESIDVLKRLAELEPQNVDHLLAIGGLYSELEQPELVVEYFRKAINLSPDDPRCVQAKKIIDQQLND
ncbi:MAG: tetratricopeptide repeat protein [Planctomycetota bacterium]